MKEIIIKENEAGQRLDKLLAKYLKEAPKSFFYKMMRKKNITLNGKKAQGNEILQSGDSVKLFLSDETYEKFQGTVVPADISKPKKEKQWRVPVVYEDESIILFNKPSGMLSQKAQPQDYSLNDYLLQYLLDQGTLKKEDLISFRPSICNRLDRNTSGLVIAGKSLAGLQEMSRILKDRTVCKYYRCIVSGTMKKDAYLKGYLIKNERTNQVSISEKPRGNEDKPIETEYKVLKSKADVTLLEVHLITGRSHQIRAHLASVGHPIVGDTKYGNEKINQKYRNMFGIRSQLLHAYRLTFPQLNGKLEKLSGQEFIAELPAQFSEIMK